MRRRRFWDGFAPWEGYALITLTVVAVVVVNVLAWVEP